MKYLEFLIAVLAIVGSLLVSLSTVPIQLLGFYVYLVCNLFAIYFFYKKKMYFILIQYLFFTLTTINGIFLRI